MSINPLISLKNVSFSYNKKILLKDINLSVNPFQSIGIVGDNGSGKSTIVKLILGLISPDDGIVELYGKPVFWQNQYPHLGYIGDPSHNTGELGLPDGILVREMIECFRVLCGISQTENKGFCIQELWELSVEDFFEKLIDILKIKDFYNRDVGRLSNGERKKLMILLALGKQPDLIIADEATEGLDKTVKPIILNIIAEGVKKKKFALLWISHRWEELFRLSDVIYELSPDEEGRSHLKTLESKVFNISFKFNNEDITMDSISNISDELKFALLSILSNDKTFNCIKQIKINISRN